MSDREDQSTREALLGHSPKIEDDDDLEAQNKLDFSPNLATSQEVQNEAGIAAAPASDDANDAEKGSSPKSSLASMDLARRQTADFGSKQPRERTIDEIVEAAILEIQRNSLAEELKSDSDRSIPEIDGLGMEGARMEGTATSKSTGTFVTKDESQQLLVQDQEQTTTQQDAILNEISEVKSPESGLLIDNFDENFVDRVAEPLETADGEYCEVCYEQYAEADFFSLSCGHRFCVNCQGDHLRTKISNGMALKLPCMHSGCPEQYTADEIQQFCSAKIQRQYVATKEDVRVGKSKKLKWCSNPDCDRVIRKPGCCCNRRAMCAECGHDTCFKCGDPYHEKSCKVSGRAGFLLHSMSTDVGRCPKCRVWTYKTDGCNHMTCRRCNAEYCWVCRQLTARYSWHNDPTNLFGCWGMQFGPYSVGMQLLYLFGQLMASPFITLVLLQYKFGQLFKDCSFGAEGRIILAILYAIFGLPFMLCAFVIAILVVFLYRLYLLLSIMCRHFLCFCCC